MPEIQSLTQHCDTSIICISKGLEASFHVWLSLQNRLVNINQCLKPAFENIHSKREMKRSNDYVICVRDVSLP